MNESRQVCDPWPYLKDRLPHWAAELYVLRYLRTWSYQTHIALQYIEKLGKFIQLECPKPGSNSCNPMISRRGDCTPRKPNTHGSEFPDREEPSVSAHPRLAEQDGEAIITKDGQTNSDENRQQTQQTGTRAHYVY